MSSLLNLYRSTILAIFDENMAMQDFGFDQLIDRSGTFSYKYELRKERFGSEDVLPMWVADMDFAAPPAVQQAIMERSRHPVYGYTLRPPEYFKTIVRWLGERYHWNVGADTLWFSPGVVPALNMIIREFTSPGDGVILQSPVYHPFFHAIEENNRVLINNQLIEKDNRYHIDFSDLEKKARKAKLMLFSHPHNPVGRSWSLDELKRIGDICYNNGILIVSDEIHADLTLNGHRHTPLASISDELSEITITCIAPSKTFNLAGLSTSTVIIKNEEIRQRFKGYMDRLHLNMGNLFGMIASIAAYEKGGPWLDALLSYLEKNIRYVSDFLASEIPQVKMSPVEATYLIWLDFRNLELTTDALNHFISGKARLGLNDGTMFGPGGEGFQRMNVACPHSKVREAMNRMKNAIHSL